MPDIIRLLFQIGGGVRKKGDHGEVIGEGYGGGSHALDIRPQHYEEPFFIGFPLPPCAKVHHLEHTQSAQLTRLLNLLYSTHNLHLKRLY
jgi:hypothetical protein